MIARLERLLPLWTEPVDGRGSGHGSGEVPRIASPMPCYPPFCAV